MSLLLGALFIFILRVTDVSLGTLRVIYTVRGKRVKAFALGFMESGLFIIAITLVIGQVDVHWFKMLAYASGFATGSFMGITVERWIGSGWIIARIISREHGQAMRQRLRDDNFGVTVVRGEGREGEIQILFIVAPRKRGQRLLQLVREVDLRAFITIEPVSQAIGGYIPMGPGPSGVRK
jgi:uncharacterized protein YebE (UPF0316 family)